MKSVARTPTRARRLPQRRFTLIELLVVVAIISVLASILLPVLSRARSMAKVTTCANNQKQTYMAAQFYIDEYEGYLPEQGGVWGGRSDGDNYIWKVAHFGGGIGTFDKTFDLSGYFACPEDKILNVRARDTQTWVSGGSAVRINMGRYILDTKYDTVVKPELTVFSADALYYTVQNNTNRIVMRHNNSEASPTDWSGPTGGYTWYQGRWNSGALNGFANVTYCDGHIGTLTRRQHTEQHTTTLFYKPSGKN